MAGSSGDSSFEKWIKQEGIPVATGYGVEDVLALPRGPWKRLGGLGTYIKLVGMGGMTSAYVTEIPPGEALNAEKHLFEEVVYVLEGTGSAEIWHTGSENKLTFEWQRGSLFAVPLNAWHRFYNASGTRPAVVLSMTNAALVHDVYHSPEFIYGDDHAFLDRFEAIPGYFAESADRHYPDPTPNSLRTWARRWSTQFVADIRTATLDPREYKLAGRQSTQLEMAGGLHVTHIAEWAGGRYDKAHYHGGGAMLLIVRGVGFSLMWPKELGIHPFESGHGDEVVRVNWREGSLFSPPSDWFHEHFNTGSVAGRQLAFRTGGKYVIELAAVRHGAGTSVSTRQGGTLIEREDEDPEIRRIFEEACAQNGTTVDMPPTAAALPA